MGNDSAKTNKKVEEALADLQLKIPLIKCPSGNTASGICLNTACNKMALRCMNHECYHCGEKQHKDCSFVFLDEMTNMLRTRTKKCQGVLRILLQIEKKVIKAIQKLQKNLIWGICMEEDFPKINEIFESRKYENLKGKEAFEIYSYLQNEKTLNFDHQISILERGIKQLTSNFQQLKQRIAADYIGIDSKVLRMKGTIFEDIQFIRDSLCNPSSINLIFRASQHDFKARNFHSKCGNINDTIVLVRTQFGRTIAGYNHYKWNEQIKRKAGTKSVEDSDRQAFLLLIDKKQKLVPQTNVGIVCCKDQCGPCFGWTALHIGDNCNIQATSTTRGIGGWYNGEYQQKKYIFESQETIYETSGVTEGDCFKVIEYQVFEVHWNEKNKQNFQKMLFLTNIGTDEEYNRRKHSQQLTQFDKLCIQLGYTSQ